MVEKYSIKFNCNYLPENFNEWVESNELNNYDNIIKYGDDVVYTKPIIIFMPNGDKYIEIAKLPTIIESFLHDFEIDYGGQKIVFEKGRKYFPIFSGIHSFKLKLNDGIKIYKEPLDWANEIFKLICSHTIIFDNIKILNSESSNESKLVLRRGLSGIVPINYDIVNENEFYFKLEDKSKIYSYDKYIQSDAFKIITVKEFNN